MEMMPVVLLFVTRALAGKNVTQIGATVIQAAEEAEGLWIHLPLPILRVWETTTPAPKMIARQCLRERCVAPLWALATLRKSVTDPIAPQINSRAREPSVALRARPVTWRKCAMA